MTNTKSVLKETPRTIRVSFRTYKELSQLGTFGDSFDSIITGLLSNQEKAVPKGKEDQTNPLANLMEQTQPHDTDQQQSDDYD
jgi:hypothetical protein